MRVFSSPRGITLGKNVQLIKECTITRFDYGHFYPSNDQGLEELLIFPNVGVKKNGIPNGSVWVYKAGVHSYDPTILRHDTGCGIAGFKLPLIDHKEAADMIADFLKGKNLLGRGNHFVDICSTIHSQYEEDSNNNILLIHTDAKQNNSRIPTNLEEARIRISDAEKLREELGYKLAEVLGVPCASFGNWTHNSVEEKEGKIIYRKGAVKTLPDTMHVMPAHLGCTVLVYTVQKNYMPPLESLPHGSGRKGPLGVYKVSEEKAKEVRTLVYVPEIIPDSSLKSEHPDCYNSSTRIFQELCEFIVGLGHIEIKAYIGKI